MAPKRRILFLCVGNSCRSHMGEGLLRAIAGDRFEALSAGTRPAGYVHPIAIQVMEEIKIDLRAHESKDLRQFVPPEGSLPDVIVAVCDVADRDCPVLPGDVRLLRWPFADPARVRDPTGQLSLAREVRDGLRTRIHQAIEAGDFG